ncbi:MAG TPA: tetratricopeptide repeat protein [Candidatus Acidoferrum sp.]|nr:tetratricopeptide repeat protein [Candidatus Acidoferrum sp.]
MFFRVPHRVLRILTFLFSFLIASCTLAQYSSLPPGEDHPVLGPKLQKELGKALEALRHNKPADARGHLETVYRSAPGDADANFLFGVYSSETNDWLHAKSYWEKVLSLSPNHLGALLSLGSVLMRESKPNEAAQYLHRAVEAEPTSWRAYAVLADAYLRQGMLDECIKQAERALELGHGQAAVVQPLLARALQLRGDRERAVLVLQSYLSEQPEDLAAARLLRNLQGSSEPAGETSLDFPATSPTTEPVVSMGALLASNWLPPDVDEKVPPVEAGVSCNLEGILDKAGKRIKEFVANVDRFAATESVTHQSINKWGFASRPLKFQFDYLVSIKEIRLGLLSVDEYRDIHYLPAKFPDGIATSGLPALVLIFHPYYSPDFKMTCEGLAHSKSGPAWQIYFRQRADKPNSLRTYQIGVQGPTYGAPLKGRAWIAADSFQIVRLETDLIAPLPQIRLVADRAAIEYGPVHFQSRNLDMWLPQIAEVFYDWRGRRSHRRHSFKNYLLFSVDDKQQIADPKAQNLNPS